MNVEKAYSRAFLSYQSGHIEDSRQICEKILVRNPKHVDALNMLGVIFFHKGDLTSASSYLSKAVELRPHHIDALLNLANVLQQQGKLEEAESCVKKVIELDTSNAEAYNILGMIHHKKGDVESAISLYKKTLSLNPTHAHAHSNLGYAFENKGCLDEALACFQKAVHYDSKNFDVSLHLGILFRKTGNLKESILWFHRALRINPHHVAALGNLGKVLSDAGRSREAISVFQQAVTLDPHYADGYYNLGIIYQQQELLNEAIICYQKAIRFDGTYPPAFNNLATILHHQGKSEEAIPLFRQAIRLDPNFAEAHYNLGTALQDRNDLDGAIGCYRRALQINPRLIVAYNNLGNVIALQGNLEEAVTIYRRALEIDPRSTLVLNNFANALKDQGKLLEAEEACRQAIEIKPDFFEACSNYLFFLNYSYINSAQMIYTEHARVGKRFNVLMSSHAIKEKPTASVGRQLRIGYVSPDFREHSVAYFIEPVIRNHTPREFKIFCYSHSLVRDHVTDRLKKSSAVWRDIAKLKDEAAVNLIRDDGIDILVDLAGHTGNNRLPIFARKPAPVQITWIGYPATTGLRSLDYKIVDHYTDPSGVTDDYYTEHLIRLPETFLCYAPESDGPDVCPPPIATTGHVTFGSFNNFPKISPFILSVWQTILHALPDSRFIVKAKSFSDHSVKTHFMDLLRRGGIDEQRVELLSWTPSRREHLELYSRIDIALDTFPYHGTTTTCEALWMGVPVVTLAGKTHASRVGVSLLTNAGLPHLIAQTEEEYVEKAIELARNVDTLKFLRFNLRSMLLDSPLTDAKRFVKNLERAYREIWERYCAIMNNTNNTENVRKAL